MPKPRQPSRPAEPPVTAPASASPPHRHAPRDGGAEVAHLGAADGGRLCPAYRASGTPRPIRRVRQIIAETPASREVDPPAGYAQLQIARLGDATRIARTKMMKGDRRRWTASSGWSASSTAITASAGRRSSRRAALAAAAKRNGRQPLEKTESGETGDCAGASP